MKRFLADTNFYLRFILQDNKAQAKTVEEYLKKAKEKKIIIVFLDEVILEIEFVLRNVYQTPRSKIAKCLSVLVKTPFLEIENRSLWIETLEIYLKRKISLFDIFLFLRAKKEKAEILSFDRDFKKLVKKLG